MGEEFDKVSDKDFDKGEEKGDGRTAERLRAKKWLSLFSPTGDSFVNGTILDQ